MHEPFGVWIDHQKAIIVRLGEDGVEATTVPSGVGPRTGRTGGTAGRTARGGGGLGRSIQDANPEDKLDRKHAQQLREFYEGIVTRLAGAGSLYLFGPGEAKVELAGVLRSSRELAERIAAVEAADKLTERQVIAQVKQAFGQGAPRSDPSGPSRQSLPPNP